MPDPSPEQSDEQCRQQWIEALLQMREHKPAPAHLLEEAREKANADGRADELRDRGRRYTSLEACVQGIDEDREQVRDEQGKPPPAHAPALEPGEQGADTASAI